MCADTYIAGSIIIAVALIVIVVSARIYNGEEEDED